MNGLTIPLDITQIMEQPENFQIEAVATAIDFLTDLERNFRDKNWKLKTYLINQMKLESATKLMIKDVHGIEKIVTLKTGYKKCEDKHADQRYGQAGFDILEIGDYIFKPSWSKAKEARKFGGDKQRIIDNLFQEGNPTLEIKEI